MMKYFVITIAFTLLFFSMCCKNEPTKPPDEIIKNPREYVWTVDTLTYPGSMQVYMKSIWASSPANVYVVGHNEDPGPGTMFHYDGIKWSTAHFHSADGGTISGAVDLFSVYGFGPNDVYAVGEHIFDNPAPPPNFLDSSLIIHFDGVQWREIQIPRMRGLVSVWGVNSQDVWAAGYYGSLYHFDGLWHRVLLDTTLSFGNIFGLSSTDIYTACARILDKDNQRDSTQYFMYHFNGSSWSPIDSSYEFPGYSQERFGFNLWGTTINIYSAYQKVYKKTGSSWTSILNTGLPFYSIFGTDDNNILVGGYGNQIYHFNGTDWFQFKQLSDATKFCTSIWCNDKEAFIVSGDGSKTWIFHGK